MERETEMRDDSIIFSPDWDEFLTTLINRMLFFTQRLGEW